MSAIGKAFVLTKSAPDPKAARDRLYGAAKVYDEGAWRSADTRDRRIMDVTYTWLKDYQGDEVAPTDSQ